VDAGGILATNFHVVADAIHEPEKYQLFLELPQGEAGRTSGPLSAEILSFDIVHDLALIRVNHQFQGAFSMASEGDATPGPGEKLWSIGKPLDLKLSMVEGSFNGEISLGDYAEYFLSTQLNPGMSGGPTLDSLGVVRGVNFAIHRRGQNVSFVVPARYLRKLMNLSAAKSSSQKSDIPKGPSERKQAYTRDVSEQMSSAGRTLVEALVQESKSVGKNPVSMGPQGLTFAALPSDFRCWQDQSDLQKPEVGGGAQKSEATLLTATQCATPFQVALAGDLPAGDIRLRISSISSQDPVVTPQDWRRVSRQVQAISKSVFREFVSARSSHPDQWASGRAGHVCRRIPFHPEQTQKQFWEASFCLDQYQQYPTLKEMALRVVGTRPTGETLLLSLEAHAFDIESMESMMRWALTGISWGDRASSRDPLSEELPISRQPASAEQGGEP
jgi:hypothetical protein